MVTIEEVLLAHLLDNRLFADEAAVQRVRDDGGDRAAERAVDVAAVVTNDCLMTLVLFDQFRRAPMIDPSAIALESARVFWPAARAIDIEALAPIGQS